MRRFFLWGSLLAAAASLGLYLGRSGPHASAQAVRLDPSLIALLPPDATTLLGVDVQRLKKTAVYQHMEEQGRKQNSPPLDSFTAATGFDPRRDVEQLWIASWPDAGSGGPKARGQFLAIARGQFNIAAITGELQDKKRTVVEKYRGVSLFLPAAGKRPNAGSPPPDSPRTAAGAPGDPGAFAFLDGNTAVAGTHTAVIAAIDRKLSGGPGLLTNTDLLARAQAISASNQIWAVSKTPGDVFSQAVSKNAAAQASNLAHIFAGVRDSTLAVDLTNGLDLKAAGVCRTSEDARTLGDAARGLVAIGRLAVSQQEPEMLSLLDRIRVEEKGSEVDVSVQLDPAMLDKLIEKTRRRKVQRAGYEKPSAGRLW